MTMREFCIIMLSLSSQYLDGRILGEDFVNAFNVVLTDCRPASLSDDMLEMLLDFQHEFAFYEEDEILRREDRDYFGPDRLVSLVSQARSRIVDTYIYLNPNDRSLVL